MIPGRYRWLLRLAVLVAVALAFLVWAGWGRSQKHLTVENRSGQSIALLRLTVAGETDTLHDVPAGAERTLPFGIKSGDPFAVDGEFAGGTMFKGGGTAGEGTHLVILPGGQILFRQAGRDGPR